MPLISSADTAWVGCTSRSASGSAPATAANAAIRSLACKASRCAMHRAVRDAGDDRVIGSGAVAFCRPVDQCAQEGDVVDAIRFGCGDAAAVGPATAVAVRVGDRDAPLVRVCVEAGPGAHHRSGRVRAVAMQHDHQRELAISGTSRVVQRKAALVIADAQPAGHQVAARCHPSALRRSTVQRHSFTAVYCPKSSIARADPYCVPVPGRSAGRQSRAGHPASGRDRMAAVALGQATGAMRLAYRRFCHSSRPGPLPRRRRRRDGRSRRMMMERRALACSGAEAPLPSPDGYPQRLEKR